MNTTASRGFAAERVVAPILMTELRGKGERENEKRERERERVCENVKFVK